MILQCSHICKSFATDVVLDDVSFHINDNEKAAIVGVNGSGKSTLLKKIRIRLRRYNYKKRGNGRLSRTEPGI